MVCNECNGKCCTKFFIFVTAHDVKRILKKLNLEPTYFLSYYPDKLGSDFPFFKIKGKKYVLGLETKSGIKDCIFLLNINGYMRCGIHENRPMNCRSYPFKHKNYKFHQVEEFLCPKQWWPEGKNREGYIKHINQFEKELNEYKKMVEIWNRNFGEKGSFIEFLNFILGEIEK